METIRTTGKMLPTHMDYTTNKSNQMQARTLSPTHTSTILAAGKQPALILLLCVVIFTWLLSAALTALKAVFSFHRNDYSNALHHYFSFVIITSFLKC
jgi:hypothetical protein